jgi:hypothetical protein
LTTSTVSGVNGSAASAKPKTTASGFFKSLQGNRAAPAKAPTKFVDFPLHPTSPWLFATNLPFPVKDLPLLTCHVTFQTSREESHAQPWIGPGSLYQYIRSACASTEGS